MPHNFGNVLKKTTKKRCLHEDVFHGFDEYDVAPMLTPRMVLQVDSLNTVEGEEHLKCTV